MHCGRLSYGNGKMETFWVELVDCEWGKLHQLENLHLIVLLEFVNSKCSPLHKGC
jgi:hypothetical protein